MRDRPEFREAKIEQLRAARRQHDVGGLQIAMDDPVAMRVVERAGDLDRVRQRLVQRQSPVRQSRGQRVALEVLHDEEVDLVMTPDVVQRADVRVRERGNRPRFAGEPGAHLLIERDARREDFDRHRAIETGVGGAEDFSHAPGAERAFNAVRAQGGTGTKIGTIMEQWCRGCPDRPIQDDTRRILAEQRLDLAPQRLVARARVGEKRVARGRILVDGQLVDSGDVLPALGSQVHLCLLAIESARNARDALCGRLVRSADGWSVHGHLKRASKPGHERRNAATAVHMVTSSPRKRRRRRNYNAGVARLDSTDITGLLKAWGQGDQGALEQLTPLVYAQLRAQARRYMRNERSGVTLQSTALVHEVYLRLINAQDVDWHDRVHFFALSAQLMRRILVDAARARAAAKRGGGAVRVEHRQQSIWIRFRPPTRMPRRSARSTTPSRA